MAIAEPADAELWPRVRALTGWPDSDEDAIARLAAGWRTGGDQFTQAGGHDIGALGEHWPDAAGAAMATRTGERLREVSATGEQMSEMARRADAYASEVTGVKNGINQLIGANQAGWAQIAAMPAAAQPAAQETFVREIAAMVDTMTQAAAGRIAAAGPMTVAPVANAAPAGPPAGASPQQVREWWDGLGVQGRNDILRDAPELVGNLDGIPAVDRHAANVQLLDSEITRLQQEEHLGQGDREATTRRLDGLMAIRDRLRGGPEGDVTLLLGLDTAGDGRAIVAVGNPDTATDVATLVPGIMNSLDDIGPLVDRAGDLRPGADTSVIAWLGYDTPDDFGQAYEESAAVESADELARFQDGLRATHDGAPSHNTVVAHSYGSTVAGHAARDYGLNADDLVLVASTDPGVQHASQYRLTGVPPEEVSERVHATRAPNDYIASAGTDRYGNDPAATEFGADIFGTPAPFNPADAHSASFDQGNPARDRIRQIIAGAP